MLQNVIFQQGNVVRRLLRVSLVPAFGSYLFEGVIWYLRQKIARCEEPRARYERSPSRRMHVRAYAALKAWIIERTFDKYALACSLLLCKIYVIKGWWGCVEVMRLRPFLLNRYGRLLRRSSPKSVEGPAWPSFFHGHQQRNTCETNWSVSRACVNRLLCCTMLFPPFFVCPCVVFSCCVCGVSILLIYFSSLV